MLEAFGAEFGVIIPLSYMYKNKGDCAVSRLSKKVADLALEVGIDPGAFQTALRREKFPLRKVKRDWEVEIGSDDYSAMRSVLATLIRRS